MNFGPLVLAIATAAAIGCGKSSVNTAPPSAESPGAGADGPSAQQRQVIAAKLREYGSGWDLDRIEQSFALGVRETPVDYQLSFIARGASGLRVDKQLGKQSGFFGGAMELPDGPALSAKQLAEVDRAFQKIGTIWVIREDGTCRPLDLSRGVAGLVGRRNLETRWRDGVAILYITRSNANDEWFGSSDSMLVIAVGSRKGSVLEASWPSLPPNDTRLVQAEEIAFIDRALGKHPELGAMGSLSKLVQTLDFYLTRRDGDYVVRFTPRQGSELSFVIDGATGAIVDEANGHYVTISPPGA